MMIRAVCAMLIERECEGVCVCEMGRRVQCEDKVFLEVYLTPALVARPQ